MTDHTQDIDRKQLLKSAYRKIEDLRARLAATESREIEPIAVVGMGCRFPGEVVDADSFWEFLSAGRDGVVEVPPDRWNLSDYYDPDPEAPLKMYVRRGGFLKNIRDFDPLFFRVSPQEASSMDPQQRLLMEVSWEALEDAGQAPDRLSGTATGVFVGLSSYDYSLMAVLAEQEVADATHAATGGSHSIAAGRISYFYGFRGPSIAIDTACASALTAVHLAVQSLRKGESKMALAGSVNLMISPNTNVVLCKARMLSADGKCKTFDASADGYARGEGCGVLVLKLLSQAQADGDRILALIRGSACNQDGQTSGITAPNGTAQREVIQAALAASGVSARDIDYVETHGTGTSLGDPIEVQALAEVFCSDRSMDRKLVLGAVKTNVGHLEPAAGMPALSKVILALQHGQIPPNLHFHSGNPLINWDSLPFLVPTELTPWPSGDRRLAGVSAFGFSGTNVHLILEQAPQHEVPAPALDRPCHLLTLSGQGPKALSELAQRYLDFLHRNPAVNLPDLCFSANTGRAQLTHRLAIVASTVDDLKRQLEDFVEDRDSQLELAVRAPIQPPAVGLFIASDTLSDVHRQLYSLSPAFKAAIDKCEAAAAHSFGISFRNTLVNSQSPALAPTERKILDFALAYAITEQWREWGIRPSAVSGCGTGGCVAAVFAEAIGLADGLRLAIDPYAKVSWSAPQTTLLSPRSGLPLTSERIVELSGVELSGVELSGLGIEPSSSLLANFQTQGISIVLAIGSSPTDWNRAGGDPSLATCIAACSSDWHGLLHAAGNLYKSGVTVDWQKFEPCRRSRIALPKYPFQRQECWLKFKSGTSGRNSLTPELHPLLGRRLQSAQFGDEIVFEAEFNTDRLLLLQDHRFFSKAVVPSAVMLEMGTTAGRIALRHGEISLDHLVIQEPLVLPDGQTSLVQTVLTPHGPDAYTFVIVSGELDNADGVATWKRHCSGELTIAGGFARPDPDPGLLDRLKARCTRAVDVSWFYETLGENGVDYGPLFQLIRSIGCSDTEVLAFLQTPSNMAHQMADYGAYPGLLDAAMQSIGNCGPFVGIYMPVAVERYSLSKAGLREMWCHATIRPQTPNEEEAFIGDVRLYAVTGELVGELSGVHFKKLNQKGFLQELDQRKLAKWLFETRWEPLPALPHAAEISGAWLIIAHDHNPRAFAETIRQRGGRAIVAGPGEGYSRQDRDNFTLQLDSPSDYDKLLHAAGTDERLLHVIYFAPSGAEGRDVPELARSTTHQLMLLTQALVRNETAGLPRLAVVTEGFQAPGIESSSSLAGSAAWGLGRVIAAEFPDLRCTLVDLDRRLSANKAAAMLADELNSASDENQVALGEGTRLGLRLAHAGSSQSGRENPIVFDSSGPVQLEAGARGDFQQLHYVPQSLVPPGPGEVQLRVLATALNFRDVLNVLGLYPGDPGALGVECVGEIVELGADVKDWSVGERVLAIPHRGYCTYTNAPVAMLFRPPANMSLTDAATILMAYLTAGYALTHLGRMKAGDRVLIHAAAGGVGLAAVQLAQKAGAEIFATAGSPAKREYLRKLGIQHVMDSRSIDFAGAIRESTGGEGVDLVLNSLTGRALSEGLALVRRGGHFLEIGKNELLSEAESANINSGAHYHIIDLLAPFRDTPGLMQQLFADIAAALSTGALRPLPHRTFSLQNVRQAYRYMADAKHIGKLIVADRIPESPTLEASGTYLITGGLGALGLLVAQWMIGQGAKRIVLVGRRAPSPAAEKTIRELVAQGAEIIVVQAEIGDKQQVAELLSRHISSSQPLRGIIHAAGVIDDGALLLQNEERFAPVLRAKIDGAWNLHELTLQAPLEFFVLFSSGAGLFGNAGQSSYAAGNVFLDALAAARQAAGLPALSIQWGPWAEVGMAATLGEQHTKAWGSYGLSAMAPAQGLTILQMLLAQPQTTQIAVIPVEHSGAVQMSAGQAIPPLLKALASSTPFPTADFSSPGEAGERLRKAPLHQRREVLMGLVAEIVLDIFGLDRGRSIPPDQNLTLLGMDSLLAIQLSNRLKKSFAAPIPSTLVFQYPTIDAMSDYLLNALSAIREKTAAQQPISSAEATKPTPANLGQELDPQWAQTTLANLDRLSNSEVESLLGAMETTSDSA